MANITNSKIHKAFYDFILKQINVYFPMTKRRPKASNSFVLKHVVFVLHTGISWTALQEMTLPTCGYSAIYKRFTEWKDKRIFENIWDDVIKSYGCKKLQEDKYAFKNNDIDSTMLRNLQGFKEETNVLGRNYQDKFKFGTKISVICDDNMIPISSVFFPSNIHDIKTIDNTLNAIPFSLTINNRFSFNLIGDKGGHLGAKIKRWSYSKLVRLI
jgi:transposase